MCIQTSATVQGKRDAQLAISQRPSTVADPRTVQRLDPLPAFIRTAATEQINESGEEDAENNAGGTDEEFDSDYERKSKRNKDRRRSSYRAKSSSPHRAKVAFSDDVIGDNRDGRDSSRMSLGSAGGQDYNSGRRFTIFSDPSEQVTLLDVHRNRQRSADYERRVHELCDRMNGLEGDKSYLLPDYYLDCLNEEAGGPTNRVNIQRPVTPESDRDPAFIYVPDSLTFKAVDMSFRSRQPRALIS